MRARLRPRLVTPIGCEGVGVGEAGGLEKEASEELGRGHHRVVSSFEDAVLERLIDRTPLLRSSQVLLSGLRRAELDKGAGMAPSAVSRSLRLRISSERLRVSLLLTQAASLGSETPE